MRTNIFKILSEEFAANHFIRIEDNKNICLYVGKDELGCYSFDFRGNFKISRISSSDFLRVIHLTCGDEKFLRFSLSNSDLLEYFCTFCEDLILSTIVVSDDNTAYQILKERYFSWKQLFRPNQGNLTEPEIMGLIGELLFLKDKMIPLKGVDVALDSWVGPEKTHKDFSCDDDWYEVKTINYGKESVRISSIEQLDAIKDGQLIIYSLERMSSSFNGLKLNDIVNTMIGIFQSSHLKDLFLAKLSLYGFDFASENDNYVYDLREISVYNVSKDFPKLKRELLPDAIIKVQYDINISDIENYRVS